MTEPNIRKEIVRRELRARGVPLGRDFFWLSWDNKDSIVDVADAMGYKKPRYAVGSRARALYEYASK